MKQRKGVKLSRVIIFLLLAGYGLFILAPFYTILITSFTSNQETMSSMKFIWWPDSFTLENYKLMFTADPFIDELVLPSLLNGFLNTMWSSLLTTGVALLVSGLAAYAYANLYVPGKKLIFSIQMATSMVPLGAFVVTGYLFYAKLGWVGTYLPITLPAMFGGTTMIFFLRTYMEGLPKEIFEAAKIDGYGTMGIYFKFIMPLSVPAFVAQFIFSFVGRYNNYLGPMLYLDESHEYTLQVVLGELQGHFGGAQVGVNCASAVFALLPMILVYCFSEKFFIEGVAANGGKE